jgi:hypothetical protein
MKNILSSLNESEKKRILEMHYRASGKQYLMEGRNDVVIGSDVLKTVGASEVIIMPQNDSVPVDFISFKMSVEKVNPEGGVAMPTYYCTTNEKNGYFAGQLYQYKPYNFTPEQITLIKTNGQKQCDHSKSEFNKSKGIVVKNQQGTTLDTKNTTTAGKEQQPTESLTKGMIDYTSSVINNLLSAFSATSINVSGDIGNKKVHSVMFQMKVDLNKDGSQPTYQCSTNSSQGFTANTLRYYQKYFKYSTLPDSPYQLMVTAGAKQCKASLLKLQGK